MNPLSFAPTSSPATAAARLNLSPRRAGDDARRVDDSGHSTRETDSVEFSAQARNVSGSTPNEPIRQDLVNSVRSQIAAGTYDTPERYLVALSRAVGQIDTTA